MYVEVEQLREEIRNDICSIKRTCISDMYGTFYASSKSTPPESDVSRYLASEEVFTHALGLLGFKVDKYMDTSGKTAYDTKVIYGYMMIQEYNSYVMAGVQRKIIFEAII